ncbi:MAG TPA: RNA methyltransferase [Thermoanaerobaculia bacterium]|jgi:TrmH family RNA methyltransferase
MKTIASRQNPLFKRVREAIREHAAEIVIEGPKPVADAIASGWTPLMLITRGPSADFPDAAVFTPEVFDSLSETRSPQDVLGLFERPSASFAELVTRRETVIVALDSVQDPGNVGTIVRLAAAFDAAGVALLPGCADAFGPKAIRSSAGAILTVPVVNVTPDELLACGLPRYAAELTGDMSDPPARAAVLIFGSEGRGIREELLRATTPIAIPMSARVESLNVAAAAAILLSRSFGLRG